MSAPPNPTTLKTKGNRLSAFARGISDGDAQYNGGPSANAKAPEKRSETPKLSSSAPTREEIVASARVPLPQNTQRVASHQRVVSVPKQSRPSSPLKLLKLSSPVKPPITQSEDPPPEVAPESPTPYKMAVQVRRPFLEDRRPLFEGSQLGDNFMNSGFTSGLTTPHNEMQDNYQEPPVERRGGTFHYTEESKGNSHDRPYQPVPHRNVGPFQIQDNGFITLNTGPDRHQPSYMTDGFQSGTNRDRVHYRTDHDRSASPVRHTTKLAVRDDRTRRPRSAVREPKRVKEDPRGPSLDFRDAQWQDMVGKEEQGSSMAINLDEETEHHIPRVEALNETPKASRMKAPPVKKLLASPMPAPEASQNFILNKKRGRASPDYDDTVLGTKTFSELRDEPFDLDPAKTVILNGHGSDSENLSKRLGQIQNQSEKERRAYFATMPLEEWEASGDWFVDQFASLMTRFKDARREKRRVVEQFEAEAASREKAVRLRSDAIDRKLVKMRQDGQRVVGGRAP